MAVVGHAQEQIGVPVPPLIPARVQSLDNMRDFVPP